MDQARLQRFVDGSWDDEIIPTLVEYIRIPNKSPSFDPDWAKHGYMDEAVTLFEAWARKKLPALPPDRRSRSCVCRAVPRCS